MATVQSPRGALLASLAVLGLLGLSVLPREHVHATHMPDGGHADVVHRHFEPHHSSGAAPELEHHSDEAAQWLTATFVAPTPASTVHPVTQFVTLDPHRPQLLQVSRGTRPVLHVSVHAPPWAASHGLRAPPIPLV